MSHPEELNAMAERITKVELMVIEMTSRLGSLEDRINTLSEVNRRRTTNISQLRRRVADLEEEVGELLQREAP